MRVVKFDDFTRGSALKIYYFLVLGKYRKIFTLTGVCDHYRSSVKTFGLQGQHGTETVQVKASFGAPYIVILESLKSYNFTDKFGKFRRTKTYKIGPYNDPMPVLSAKQLFDPYDYLYAPFVAPAERQRLRRKFRL